LTTGDPGFERFKAAFDAVTRRIESRYGVEVRISDVLDPNTGDFDGVAISIDHAQNVDMALFVLLHLFGHTVQWNVSPESRALGIAAVKVPVDESLLPSIREYERRASALGLSLLHECGIRDLDGWLSDWNDADWRYLEHYYRTGEKLPFHELVRPDRPLLAPEPIPDFSPRRWVSRYSF
jgi:hypothetical protein